MPLFRKEKRPFTKEQKFEVKKLLAQRRILVSANQKFKKVLSDSEDLFSKSDQEFLKNNVTGLKKAVAVEEKVPTKLPQKRSLLPSNSLTEEQKQILTEVVKELETLSNSQYLFLDKNIEEKRKQLESIVASNEKRIADIVKRLVIIDKERTKINYRESVRQLFQRTKVKPEEVTSNSSANVQTETTVVGSKSLTTKITSEQEPTDVYKPIALEDSLRRFEKNRKLVGAWLDEQEPLVQTPVQQVDIEKAMAEALSLKWQANNSKAFSLWLDEQEQLAQVDINKPSFWQSFKKLFSRNKSKPEEVTNKSSKNEKKSKQVVKMSKAIEKGQTKPSFWQSFKKLFSRNKKVNFDLLTNNSLIEKTEIEKLKTEPLIPKKLWTTAAEIISPEPVKSSSQPNSDAQSTEGETRVVTPVVVHSQPSFDSDVDDEDDEKFVDAVDVIVPEPVKESSSQPNSDAQSTEGETRVVTPVVVHSQPSFDSDVDDEDDEKFVDAVDVIVPEPVKESSSQPNSDAQSDEEDNGSRVLTNDGYHTQSSSDSENGAEVDTLMISNTNSKPVLKSQMNSLSNQIVIKKVKNLTWKIQQKSENNKISKEILLKAEEDNILENLIKEYKSNIIITFDKNTKKFKEAFVIDNQGNKKIIVINEKQKIMALEKVFAKVTATLARSWNDSYVDIANNFEKKQSLSNASRLKTHSEKNG